MKYLAANLEAKWNRLLTHERALGCELFCGAERLKTRFHLRVSVGADAEELAERHTQSLVEVVVEANILLDSLGVPLQQVEHERPQVPSDQESVLLLYQELSQTAQDGLSVLLAPYLKIQHEIQGVECRKWSCKTQGA